MATSTTDPQVFNGPVSFFGTVAFPATCVGGTQMNPSDPVSDAAVRHRFEPRLAQALGAGAAVAERRVVHHANRAGAVTALWAGAVVANVGAATYTVDLYRNGVTMLTAPLVVTSTLVAYNSVAAALVASPVFAAGDVLEVVLTVAAGGGTLAQGVFVKPVIYELP